VRARLKVVPAADAQRIHRLAADLDSDSFAVRERATAELQRLGGSAEAALHRVLAGRPSPEVRQWAERILQRREHRVISAEELRMLRAVEVLERTGVPEAREVLRALAGGAPEAWVTREAKAALERLQVSPKR
jgi:hypothetical protein